MKKEPLLPWAVSVMVALLVAIFILNMWVNEPCPPGKPGAPDPTIVDWIPADPR